MTVLFASNVIVVFTLNNDGYRRLKPYKQCLILICIRTHCSSQTMYAIAVTDLRLCFRFADSRFTHVAIVQRKDGRSENRFEENPRVRVRREMRERV